MEGSAYDPLTGSGAMSARAGGSSGAGTTGERYAAAIAASLKACSAQVRVAAAGAGAPAARTRSLRP